MPVAIEENENPQLLNVSSFYNRVGELHSHSCGFNVIP